jgi:hypothetical protein
VVIIARAGLNCDGLPIVAEANPSTTVFDLPVVFHLAIKQVDASRLVMIAMKVRRRICP